jgi:hypothetical protein
LWRSASNLRVSPEAIGFHEEYAAQTLAGLQVESPISYDRLAAIHPRNATSLAHLVVPAIGEPNAKISAPDGLIA